MMNQTLPSGVVTVLVAGLLLLAPERAAAQPTYRCIGAEGKISFSDRPCELASETQLIHGRATSGGAAAAVQDGKAPQELVDAYKRCQSALRQRALETYSNCLSRRRGDMVRQAKTAFEGLAVGTLALMPEAPKTVDGSVNRTEGQGTLRLTGELDGKRRFGVMDFVLEQGAWKLDTQNWSNVPFDEMPKFVAELNASKQRQQDFVCSAAKDEPIGGKTVLLDIQPGEKLISRFVVAPGGSRPFAHPSPNAQLVMSRANATARLQCKFGTNYPVSICYAGEPCLSTWYGGRIMQAVDGRIRGVIKNTADEGIEVIVFVAPER